MSLWNGASGGGVGIQRRNTYVVGGMVLLGGGGGGGGVLVFLSFLRFLQLFFFSSFPSAQKATTKATRCDGQTSSGERVQHPARQKEWQSQQESSTIQIIVSMIDIPLTAVRTSPNDMSGKILMGSTFVTHVVSACRTCHMIASTRFPQGTPTMRTRFGDTSDHSFRFLELSQVLVGGGCCVASVRFDLERI